MTQQLDMFTSSKESPAVKPASNGGPRASAAKASDYGVLHTEGGQEAEPAAAANLRGLQYRALKREPRNERGLNQHSEVSGQNDHQPKTAEMLAQRHGVTEATIRRDARPQARRQPSCSICGLPALFSHGQLHCCSEHGRAHLQRLASGRYFAEGEQ